MEVKFLSQVILYNTRVNLKRIGKIKHKLYWMRQKKLEKLPEKIQLNQLSFPNDS